MPPPRPASPAASGASLLVDGVLPTHIVRDRSLFRSYEPSERTYRTPHGATILVEGVGDVHLRVHADGKDITMVLTQIWHCPSFPHDIYSIPHSVLRQPGNQVILSQRKPRIIVSDKARRERSFLPKYFPLSRVEQQFYLMGVFIPPPPSSTAVAPPSSTVAASRTSAPPIPPRSSRRR